MRRINVRTVDEYGAVIDEGWFDADAAEWFDEATQFNGNNHISVNTGSQWDHQDLYRTAGSRWVLHSWSQWQGSLHRYVFIDAQAARAWLIRNTTSEGMLMDSAQRDVAAAIEKYFGPVESEHGPNDARIEAGAQALKQAYPTLVNDYTDNFFRKVAKTVLEAADTLVRP